MKEEIERGVSAPPKISVIVPVYNAEKYLHRCIDSILSQTFTDFELLLIDDGSKDKSGTICDEYAEKDSRVKVFHKKNGGVSSARNLGLDNAKGEWICFVDSDDYIESGFLQSFEGNLDSDLVVGNMVSLSHQGVFGILSPGIDSGFHTKDVFSLILALQAFRVPWGKMFRKDCIGKLRFNVQLKIGEDNHFILCFLHEAGSLRVLSSASLYDKYVYVESGISCDRKYQITVESSVYHLLELEAAYQALGVCCISYEIYNVQAYYERCVNDMPVHGAFWYKNKEIEKICLRRSLHLGVFSWIKTWLSFHIFYNVKIRLAKKNTY